MASVVYVGNTESNEILVLRLDRQSGDLTLVERVPIPGVATPGGSTPMAVSPDRTFLYAGTRGEPKIAAGFAIDPASGTLTHVASGPLADSLAYIAVDRTGRFLLGASYPGHKVTVNPIDPEGTVALPPDFQAKPSAADLHLTPDGRFLYASVRGSSTLAGFRIDPANGALTPLGSVPTKTKPRGFAIDSSGRYLLAVGQLSHAMSTYRIDPGTGTLTKLKDYPMGKNPNWIEIVDL